ncbi:hypothetical protein [Rhodoferax sp.]|uniref:hypothetical protein n=1 Tax=Rhodoferax sp. TaxID=50421 RepID=UPI00262303D3|nr:hypothetical protein [Rhodoferax sp.]MDD2926876.1 hypothetical protein [Rhodoferax sp.]
MLKNRDIRLWTPLRTPVGITDCNPGQTHFRSGFQNRRFQLLVTGKFRCVGQRKQCASIGHQGRNTPASKLQAGSEAGQVKQFDVVPDHVAAAVLAGPAHGRSNTRLPGRKKYIRFGPVNRVVPGQRHRTLKPGALACVIVQLAHFAFFQNTVSAPGQPVGLTAPLGWIAQTIDPLAIIRVKQQDFAAGLM